MSALLGMLRNFLPFKDGGAIPPSNAMQRAAPKRLERLAKPTGMLPLPADFTFLGKRIIRPVPKKQGGAIPPNFFVQTPKMPNPPGMPPFRWFGTKPVPKKKGGAVKKKGKKNCGCK